MTQPISEQGLSPLDQIRQAEAETARKIIAAHTLSDQHIAKARAQAGQLKQEARESGEREGRIRHKEIVTEAEMQAKMIVAQADQEAERLRRKGDSRMEQAIDEAIAIVLGRKAGQTNNEP